jgi:hypothetical protein
MTRVLIYVLTTLILSLVVACAKPDRKTFGDAWKAAVASRDGRAAWDLLDKASRERIIAGLKRSQEKAKQDEEFRRLFSYVNAPADTNLSTEELAIVVLGQVIDQSDIVDDGTTKLVHIEGGKWRASVEPVGFVGMDGVPLTLSVRLSAGNAGEAAYVPLRQGATQTEPDPQVGQDLLELWLMKDSQGEDLTKMSPEEYRRVRASNRLIKDVVDGFAVHPSWNGKKPEDIKNEHAKIAAVMAEHLKLRGFEPYVKKIMDYYWERLGDSARKGGNTVDYGLVVDRSGGLSASLAEIVSMNKVSKPQPHLNFGSWPAVR